MIETPKELKLSIRNYLPIEIPSVTRSPTNKPSTVSPHVESQSTGKGNGHQKSHEQHRRCSGKKLT